MSGLLLTDIGPTDDLTLADDAPDHSRPNPWRVAAMGTATGASALLVLDHQRRRWWRDRNPRFRILSDWEYSLWADKAGHFVAASVLTRTFRSTLRWSGLPAGQSRAWAAGAAWANMFYYEVLDGFGPHWGFSPGDLLFNTLGVAFATAQDVSPVVAAFDVRVSYWPSGWENKEAIDDYAGQTYWLSVSPHRLAPDGMRRYLPPWLGVAVGYGAREPGEYDMLQEAVVYVGLDLDLSAIPISHPAWRALTGVLRYVHLPAPAIQLSPHVGFEPLAY